MEWSKSVVFKVTYTLQTVTVCGISGQDPTKMFRIVIGFNVKLEPGMVINASNPRTLMTKGRGPLCSRPAWSPDQVP